MSYSSPTISRVGKCGDCPALETRPPLTSAKRVRNFQNADLALCWAMLGFGQSKSSMRRIKGYAWLPDPIGALGAQHEPGLAAQ